MALFNKKKKKVGVTTNLAGGAAFVQTPKMQLASLLLTSFAQDQFYRSADDTFADVARLMGQVDPLFAAKAVIYARTQFGMRSISHVLAVELATGTSGQPWAKAFYDKVVLRPDDMIEIVARYQALGGKHLTNAMKKGFAAAFDRFDGYQLAKYKGANKAVKLVDLVNMVHPVPTHRNAAALAKLVRDELKSEGTWEAKLTQAGQKAEHEDAKAEMKAAAWAELLAEGKLGYFALLRNLRNIAEQAPELVGEATKLLTDRKRIKQSMVLPFRFLTAQDAIMQANVQDKRALLRALNTALEISLDNVPTFEGKTLVVLDDSGSMTSGMGKHGFGAPIRIGAVFAAILYKKNDADLMRFSDDAAYVRYHFDDTATSIAERLVQNARAAGTNFDAIFETAKGKYKRIVILSDMQGWMGRGAPTDAFAKYKARTGARPLIYSFDLNGYGSLQFPERGVFALAGFSEKVFDLMALLESDPKALVSAIEAVAL
jgi:60 kDa SS-A/Ro ribonucleoprotein